MSKYHTPVLVRAVIEGLAVTKGKRYIDATVGGGGHTYEIVKRGGIVLAIDADREAIEFTRKYLSQELADNVAHAKEGREWILAQGNFADIVAIAKKHGFERVDGVLFDLGVSSHQIDTPERGFSYRFKGMPLDLRFNQSVGETGASLLQRLQEDELYEIIARYGEEELARAIAHAIVSSRHIRPADTTDVLIDVVESIVVDPKQHASTLSRVFQALRIVVNDELQALKLGLLGASTLLMDGGRLVVISFHSLEDRIVKRFIQRGTWKMMTDRPILASKEEIASNYRARSAKLRIAQKI